MKQAQIRWLDVKGYWSAWFHVDQVPDWFKNVDVKTIEIKEEITKLEYETRYGRFRRD